MADTSAFITEFRDGKSTRKEAIGKLLSSGLSIAQAFESIGDTVSANTRSFDIRAAAMDQTSKDLQNLASNPAILSDLLEVQAQTDEDRKVYYAQNFVSKWSKPENLKNVGFSADGYRLALRVFEKPSAVNLGLPKTLATTKPLADTFMEGTGNEMVTALTICGSIGYIVCGSIGGDPS